MCAQRSRPTDVLIIGSGGAGVAAAIEAAEQGAAVVVLEGEATLGGAAAISGGGCSLVQTPLQEKQGIKDSPDLAFADWLDFGGGSADEEWARFYIEHTLHDLYEWAEARGVCWVGVSQPEGNSVPRWHRPEDGGPGLWRALHGTAIARGADCWLAAMKARELVMQRGKVVGVRGTRTDTGEPFETRAKAVVIATGGFASNVEMIHEYCPQLRGHRILEGSHVGARGEGHDMVGRAGGVLTHMDALWLYAYSTPDYRDPRGKRGLAVRGIADAIWVNSSGRRFHNEDLTGGASGAPALLRQTPAACWAIIDSTMVAGIAVGDPYYYKAGSTERDPDKTRALIEGSPDIKTANTVEGLARLTGVPPAALVDSLARYNGFLAQGLATDPDCGRPLAGRKKIATPPLHAFRFYPLARKNFGGVRTNLRCQVLDKHYEPIPGLYAAGEVAGMAGGHINGGAGLEGTMLGPALFSGRVAGAWAARAARHGRGFVGTPNRE